ncbi:MAG: hypothetical protein ACKOWE_02540 [Micrococcales bacterium]
MIEIAFLVVYTVIIALVTPYIVGKSEYYGTLVPAGISLVYGSLLWVILSVSGLKSDNAWIWIITMFTMPIVMYIGVYRLRQVRVRNAGLNEKADQHIAEHGEVKNPFAKFGKKKKDVVAATGEDVYVTE